MFYEWSKEAQAPTEQQERFSKVFLSYMDYLTHRMAPDFFVNKNLILERYQQNLVNQQDQRQHLTLASDTLAVTLLPQDAKQLNINSHVRVDIFSHLSASDDNNDAIVVDDYYAMSLSYPPRSMWYHDVRRGTVWRPAKAVIDDAWDVQINTKTMIPTLGAVHRVAMKIESKGDIEEVSVTSQQTFADLDLSHESIAQMAKLRVQGNSEEDASDRTYEFVLSLLIAIANATNTREQLDEIHTTFYGNHLFSEFKNPQP